MRKQRKATEDGQQFVDLGGVDQHRHLLHKTRLITLVESEGEGNTRCLVNTPLCGVQALAQCLRGLQLHCSRLQIGLAKLARRHPQGLEPARLFGLGLQATQLGVKPCKGFGGHTRLQPSTEQVDGLRNGCG